MILRNPTIGFWGGMALLVSSITGPGLTTGKTLPRTRTRTRDTALTTPATSPPALPASGLAAVPVQLLAPCN
jgi:hypothetical protein